MATPRKTPGESPLAWQFDSEEAERAFWQGTDTVGYMG
jgi:hypothetical protein